MAFLNGLLRLLAPTGWWRNRVWLLSLAAVGIPVLTLPILIPDPTELLIAEAVYLFPVLWGISAAITARERLTAEAALLERAEANASDHIRRIQSQDFNLELDGSSWELYVPKNPMIGRRIATTTRMVQSLCNEAMANRIPPISTTAQVYASELGTSARGLRTPQTVALRLGILVTFIGLIGAMQEIGNLVLANPQSTDETLKAMGAHLTKAFGASVAGLLAALAIQAFVELVQAQQRSVASKIEEVVSTLANALSLAQVGKAFRITIDKFGHRLDEHRKDLNDHAFQVKESTTAAVKAVAMNAEEFQNAAAQVGGDNHAMTELLRQHQSLFEKMMASVEAVGSFEQRLRGVIIEETGRIDAGSRAMGATMASVFEKVATPLLDKAERQAVALATASDGLVAAAERFQSASAAFDPAGAGHTLDRDMTERLVAALDRSAPPRRSWALVLLAGGFSLGLGLLVGATVLIVLIERGFVTVEHPAVAAETTAPQTSEQPQ